MLKMVLKSGRVVVKFECFSNFEKEKFFSKLVEKLVKLSKRIPLNINISEDELLSSYIAYTELRLDGETVTLWLLHLYQ